MDRCFKYGGARIVMPEQGVNDILQFKDYSKQLESPIKMYADFEAVIKKNEDSEKGIKQIHEISGYTLYVKSPYEEDIWRSYRGDDAGQIFIGTIQSLSKELKKKIGDSNAEKPYREKEKEEFENSKKCHICEFDIEKNLSLIHI